MSLFGKAGRRGRGRDRIRTTKLGVELFEDRTLLSTQQFLVTTTANSGAGSLRQAIDDANTSGQPSIIDFDIPGNGPYDISLSTGLTGTDAVKVPTLIDGTSQPGYAGTPLIQIDGNTNNVSGDALDFAAGSDGSRIRGLDIYGFSSGAAVHIQSTNDSVQNNYLGTDVTGTSALGNQEGVLVDGVSGATIGGTTSIGNLISGNTTAGILIQASGTTVAGNLIGTNAAGASTSGLGNPIGIDMTGSSNTIGTTTQGAGNVISSLSASSIGVEVASGTQNPIRGNSISVTGQAIALGTGANLNQSPPTLEYATTFGGSTLIDGVLPAADFIASSTYQVDFYSGAEYIGSDPVTTNASGNTQFSFTTSNIAVPIGQTITATATDSNGNTSEHSTTNATVVDPFVVTTTSDQLGDVTGQTSLRQAITNANNDTTNPNADTITFAITGSTTITLSADLPELKHQVIIDGTTQSGYSGTPLVIINAASAPTYGLQIGAAAAGSTIRGLEIVGNPTVAIDLESGTDTIQANVLGTSTAPNKEGVLVNGSNNTIGGTSAAGNVIAYSATAVDVASGTDNTIRANLIYSSGGASIVVPTGSTQAPTLTSATSSSSTTTVSGTFTTSAPAGTIIDFYAYNATQSLSPAVIYLGSYTMPAAGTTFTTTPPLPVSVSTLDKIVATATSPAGETSAFSASVAVTNPFTVTTNATSGPGSLFQAITNVNNDTTNANADTISFALTGSTTITLTADLPELTHPVIIDGTTQSGYSGTPLVIINAAGAPDYGLQIGAANSTIRGLEIIGNPTVAIDLESNGDTVQANVLGTSAAPNAEGVLVNGSNNTIGGTSAAAGNVIAYSATAVDVKNGNDDNTIRANLIYASGGASIVVPTGSTQAPTLTSATSSSSTTTVQGTFATSVPAGTIIDFYAYNATQSLSPAVIYLGSYTTTAAGTSFTTNPPLPVSVSTLDKIVATATSPAGETSAFSASLAVTSPFLVTTNATSGPGSLFQAITNVNNDTTNPNTDTISFAITGSTTITLTADLPELTHQVIIDGTTQSGYSGTPVVIINAAGAPDYGLQIGAANSTIRGLEIIGSPTVAIDLESSGDTVQANVLGTSAAPNKEGVLVNGSNNTIGGPSAAAGNVIAYSATAVDVTTGNNDNTIRANLIYDTGAGASIVVPTGSTQAPTLTSATSSSSTTTVEGTFATSVPVGTIIDFYAYNATQSLSPAVIYLGSYTTTAAGTSFTTNPPLPVSVSTLDNIVATATSPAGETSAFSASLAVTNPFLVTTNATSGPGSLFQAITNVNNDTTNPNADTISFAITGSTTITLTGDLPELTHQVIIDGTTQSGYSGTPLVVIDGAKAPDYGLQIGVANSTIRGLEIVGVPGPAIDLESGGNTVQANVLGTSALPNTEGVLVNGSNNTIGGPSAAAGNVIAYSTTAVNVTTGNNDNTIRANLIYDTGAGASIVVPTGSTQAPTLGSATSSSSTTTITGTFATSAPAGTIIDFYAYNASQSLSPAVIYLGSYTTTAAGTSFTTTPPLPVSVSTLDNIVATVTSLAGETSAFSNSLAVQNPFVVTNTLPSGVGSLSAAIAAANATPPIAGPTDQIVFNIPTTLTTPSITFTITLPSELDIQVPVTIDGTTELSFLQQTDPSVGFTQAVINVTGGGTVTNGFVLTTATTPATSSAGSSIVGLEISDFTGDAIQINTSNNTIGGTAAGLGNTITGNTTGTAVDVLSGSGNAIRQNLIYDNKNAIVLANNANNNQAAPTNLAVTSVTNLTTIDYQITGIVGDTYAIDFYASSTLGDPAAQFLGTVTTPALTSATQSFTATLTLATPIADGQTVTATVTDTNIASTSFNSTSEFADSVGLSAPFQVTNTTDNVQGSFVGSLRQAILDENSSPAAPQSVTVTSFSSMPNTTIVNYKVTGTVGQAYTIDFFTSSSGGLLQFIGSATTTALTTNPESFTATFALATAIPAGNTVTATNNITFAIGTGSLVINVSATAALPTITVPVTIDGTTEPGVVINGGHHPYDGLTLAVGSGTSAIEGLTILDFGGNGIVIQSSNDTIGGTAAGAGNVIGLNTSAGILITSGNSSTTVQGNQIGTSNSTQQSNGFGVQILNASSNTIGGTATGAANTIGFNNVAGVSVSGTTASANVISGNTYSGTNGALNLTQTNDIVVPNVLPTPTLLGAVVANNQITVAIQFPSGFTTNSEVYFEFYIDNENNQAVVPARTYIPMSQSSEMDYSSPITLTFPEPAGFIIYSTASPMSTLIRATATFVQQGTSTGPTGTTAFSNAITATSPLAVYTTADDPSVVDQLASGEKVYGIPGSLRFAIEYANATYAGTRQTISFAIPTTDNNYNSTTNTYTITPVAETSTSTEDPNPLFTITAPVFIDGTTQSGFNSISPAPLIVISDGKTSDGMAIVGNGLTLDPGSGGSTIQALAIEGFSGGAGIEIDSNTVESSSAVTGDTIVDDWIGFDPSTVASGNTTIVPANSIGIYLTKAATKNSVGAGSLIISGTTPPTTLTGTAIVNRISNNGVGVQIDSSSGANVLQNNQIGVAIFNLSNKNPITNSSDGVLIMDSSNNSVGMANGDVNVISGNKGFGIHIEGASSTGNNIVHSYIGTDPTGTFSSTDIGNQLGGILIEDASGNVVGGTNPSDLNIISGNQNVGVSISEATLGNKVYGNWIGIGGTTGQALIPNAGDGIDISYSSSNSIGGASGTTQYGNTISANTNAGVAILGTSTSNQIEANLIGGTGAGQGNLSDGIAIHTGSGDSIGGSAGSSAFTIGSLANSIIGNTGQGVDVFAAATDITIQGNWIARNIENGIQLTGDLSGAARESLIVDNFVGTSQDGTTTYDVSNNTDKPYGNGLNGIALIATTSNGGSSATGVSVSGNVVSGNGLDGISIASSSSSTMATARVLIVDNLIGTNRTGTLVTDPTIASLPLGNVLDGIQLQEVSGVTIGGTTPGASVNLLSLATSLGNLIAGNLGRGIEIDAGATSTMVDDNLIGVVFSSTSASGISPVDSNNNNSGNLSDGVFVFQSSGNSIQGNVISANRGYGIHVTGNGTALPIALTISGNFIGTNQDGTAVLTTAGQSFGNGDDGIDFDTVAGTSATMPIAVVANVISGNRANGVDLLSSSNIRLTGNYIGTNAQGQSQPGVAGSDFGNASDGVFINESSGNTIGGLIASGSSSALGASNVIAGNHGSGVFVSGSPGENNASNNSISGNFIGISLTGPDQYTVVPNAVAGVILSNANGNSIGGSSSSDENVISGNSLDGILLVNNAQNNLIQNNDIGTDPSGVGAVPNSADGIFLLGSSSGSKPIPGVVFNPNPSLVTGNTVQDNIISGNNENGIQIFGTGASSNTVISNIIGLAVHGDAALINGGNKGNGVYLNNDGGHNIIGQAGSPNIIAGNGQSGVLIYGTSLKGGSDVVQDNIIGTNAAGTPGIGNDGDGVFIYGTSLNSVSRNTISANSQAGVAIFSPATTAPANSNTISGNLIGGASKLGNQSDGVDIYSGLGNVIGLATSWNTISGNAGNGVLLANVSGQSPSGNTISGNYIGLGPAGSNLAANQQNGVLVEDGSGNQIGVPMNSLVSGTNVPTSPSNVIAGNGASGIQFSGTASGNSVEGNYIGVLANGTSSLGNTFAGVFINNLGTNPSNETIGGTTAGDGNIIGGSSSGFGVDILGPAGGPSAGNVIQGNLIGIGAGSSLAGNSIGVYIQNSAGNSIGGSGSAGNVISANPQAGVELTGLYSTGNTILGNEIGTDISGTMRPGGVSAISAAFPVQTYGVDITTPSPSGGGTNNRILNNVISGNLIGVNITGVGSGTGSGQGVPLGQNLIQGNKIGTDPSGMSANPNFEYGIYINNSAGNTISGGNVISANGVDGVEIFGGTTQTTAAAGKANAAAARNFVESNLIGVNAKGQASFTNSRVAPFAVPDGPTIDLGEQLYGVVVIGSSSNVIGAKGVGNTIGSNVQAGVYITVKDFQGNTYATPTNNTLNSNTIMDNGIYGVYRYESPKNSVAERPQRYSNKFRGNAINLADYVKNLNGNTQLPRLKSRFTHGQDPKKVKGGHGHAKRHGVHEVVHVHAKASHSVRPRVPALFHDGARPKVVEHARAAVRVILVGGGHSQGAGSPQGPTASSASGLLEQQVSVSLAAAHSSRDDAPNGSDHRH
jgi:hypothetical protein